MRLYQGLWSIGLGVGAAVFIAQSGFALNGPMAINYDLGDVGQYSISGGASGYGVFFNNGSGNLANTHAGNFSGGLANALINVQKTSGLIRFNF